MAQVRSSEQESLKQGQKSLQQEVSELKNIIETTVKGYADSYKINDHQATSYVQ